MVRVPRGLKRRKLDSDSMRSRHLLHCEVLRIYGKMPGAYELRPPTPLASHL